MINQKTPWALKLTVMLASLALIISIFTSATVAQLEGVSNFNGVHLDQSTFGTATPQFEIHNQGSNQSLRVLDSGGTPEIVVDADGGMTVNDLTAPGLTISSGGMTVSAGLATFAGGVNCTPQTTSVSDGFDVVPVSCIVSITSTSAITAAGAGVISSTSATDGDIVILANNNPSDAITIDGTGSTIECKSDVTLGAGDTLTLWYNGTDSEWNCLANYDNS